MAGNPLSRGDLNGWKSPLERGFRGVLFPVMSNPSF